MTCTSRCVLVANKGPKTHSRASLSPAKNWEVMFLLEIAWFGWCNPALPRCFPGARDGRTPPRQLAGARSAVRGFVHEHKRSFHGKVRVHRGANTCPAVLHVFLWVRQRASNLCFMRGARSFFGSLTEAKLVYSGY